MSPAGIRLMRPTERGAVRNLGAAVLAPFGAYGPTLDAWLRNPTVVALVAPGAPLGGFAMVGRLERGEPLAYLLALGVAEDRRRAGLGRALLEAAIGEAARRAARWGVDRLALEVAGDNAPARALFGAAGFVEIGPGPAYPAGQASVAMERPLEGARPSARRAVGL